MAITSVKINNYVRSFDKTDDGSEPISNYYGYTPLKSGNSVPYFHHPLEKVLYPKNKNKTKFVFNELTTSHEILNNEKPVVLVFRPIFHNDADIQRLFLESLQADINVMGGKLTIITNATIRSLSAGLHQPNSLHIFSDTENKIAELFGLYNSENQISDWLSGIEGDISLPAYYVINPDGKIVYHYIDYNFRSYKYDHFDGQHFVRQLLTNVYQNAQRLKQLEKV
ncbi:hypothetical protein A9P82_05430 [Arachidicoccus ginsenosidimutans]|uniref:redoxin domain-containing protein n=1 Tax=Arachidicoccus sp. BS20 TaxID=1850526 RepID=UPI0007F106EC|nr:redoxin domain-containing protein [Arachidicoccus sp. BS20]ANI88777.1 hypothetical protein A9P82_05430 [Arachidicoccus sp. BS20]